MPRWIVRNAKPRLGQGQSSLLLNFPRPQGHPSLTRLPQKRGAQRTSNDLSYYHGQFKIYSTTHAFDHFMSSNKFSTSAGPAHSSSLLHPSSNTSCVIVKLMLLIPLSLC